MRIFIKYLKIAIIYFILQSVYEILGIAALTYAGIPYSGLEVGNERFYEIVVGIAGYFTIQKVLTYGWAYIILFVVISRYAKLSNHIKFSLLNGILSLAFIAIIYLNGKPFDWILNPLVATIFSSLFVAITLAIRNKFKSQNRI